MAAECIKVPINFQDIDFKLTKSEANSNLENSDDTNSTVCTVVSEDTADSAYADQQQKELTSTSIPDESLDDEVDYIHEIESHFFYQEEQDDTYLIPVHKNGMPRDKSLTPISIMVVDTIGLKKSRALLKVLLDPGSTKTLISRKALPKGTKPTALDTIRNVSTLAGSMQTSDLVHLRDMRLPEFDKNRRIDEQKALVFDGKC